MVRTGIGTLRGEIHAVRDELRGEIQASAAETRQYINDKVAETRRHFGVLVEDAQSKIQAVAEGVSMTNETLERFREEVREHFSRVDHRLLRLEAGVGGPAAP